MIYYRNIFKIYSIKRVLFRKRNCKFSSSDTINEEKYQTDYSLTDVDISLRMLQMVQAFRQRGHYAASLDPLSESPNSKLKRQLSWLPKDPDKHPDVVKLLRNYPKELNLEPFELDNVSIDKKFYLGNSYSKTVKFWSIRELIDDLKLKYCSNVGIEFSHIENVQQRLWLKGMIESNHATSTWKLSNVNDKIFAFNHLLKCDMTAKYLHKKFPSAKVFGIEGGESLIPGLWSIAITCAELGVEGIEVGMAHRGRMNVLHNFFNKEFKSICNLFHENDSNGLGDMKYHIGTRSEILISLKDGSSKLLRLSLAANPSHLESVNPVVIGQCKAKQMYIDDKEMKRVIPLLIHGDAAFSGQGLVSETFELSNLPDYTVGGCIHVIINNQIGFTTDPHAARTSFHCTNIAKTIGAPIFHVNGDDIEAVVSVCKLAAQWRQTFSTDVVVDIISYRRSGHNSIEDPSITQPLTYQLIHNHPSTLEIYKNELIAEGILTQEFVNQEIEKLSSNYELEYWASKKYITDKFEWLSSNWQGKAIGSLLSERPYNQTGVSKDVLMKIGQSLLKAPPHFKLHPDIEKLFKSRKRMLDTGEGITFAFAEALAFGCLMTNFSPISSENRTLENAYSMKGGLDVSLREHPQVNIRLSGQDVIRGTFNQRHAAIYDQNTGDMYWQLNNLEGMEQSKISVCNSSLSEAGILAFEYGYSLANELSLVIWEAQFGDFANNAQAIIDNFVASGESKWKNLSSLVLLLPHGFEGQGPDHSSGRLERFLSLVDDDYADFPGLSEGIKREIETGFDLLLAHSNNQHDFTKNTVDISKDVLIKAFLSFAPQASSERIEIAIAELLTEQTEQFDTGNEKISNELVLTKETWYKFMSSWLHSNSERKHNLIVVNPTTPAQYFHCLRRQIHRFVNSRNIE